MSQKHTTSEASKRATPPFRRKGYNVAGVSIFVMNEKRTMPVCFTPGQLKIVEEYGRKKGMLNASQAIEELTQ